MAQPVQDSAIFDAVELLKDNGFDGLAEAVTGLLNTAIAAVPVRFRPHAGCRVKPGMTVGNDDCGSPGQFSLVPGRRLCTIATLMAQRSCRCRRDDGSASMGRDR